MKRQLCKRAVRRIIYILLAHWPSRGSGGGTSERRGTTHRGGGGGPTGHCSSQIGEDHC